MEINPLKGGAQLGSGVAAAGRLAWLLLACIALAACSGGEGPRAPDEDSHGITARAMLGQAMAEAGKWRPDAELIAVSTSLADGPQHMFWFYDVQSRASSSCTRIRTLANGEVDNVGTGGSCMLMTPVSTDFVDSPIAWKAARAAGFQAGDSVQLSLQFKRDAALPEPRTCWVLWSEADRDGETGLMRGWCVDPVSGEFLVRLSGRGGSVRLQQ